MPEIKIKYLTFADIIVLALIFLAVLFTTHPSDTLNYYKTIKLNLNTYPLMISLNGK